MSFTPELVAELEVLALFDLESTLEGLKIHQAADPRLIEGAKRLYEKDLINQPDGGYLTSLGRDAAEHVQGLLLILNSESKLGEKLAEIA
ncbi:TIGR02647 family protein [Pseudomonas sp. 7P_10.2_Bac1]|uniref:TIGR02647 family protein n=1 Tax=Pseudomonas sp. 7P_10.2_Bac1 TaxID=2971614 RepID=UPI0021C961B4|nr:TIGR02647 family protein [Pseudomonas sp. 7P_10.2_Bac1]MCU1725540.1 TIGR02647 family protein [Pseudomonas sp. 7P_10.2_Bac1]